MRRALCCVHCGAVVELEQRPESARPRTHLLHLHAEIVAVNDVSRWDRVFEHFRVVPRRQSAMPRVIELH